MERLRTLSSWDLTKKVRQEAGVRIEKTPPPIGACTIDTRGPNLHKDKKSGQWVSSSPNQLPSDYCTNMCGDGFKWVTKAGSSCIPAQKVDVAVWQPAAIGTTTAIAEKPTRIAETSQALVPTVFARRTVFAQEAADRKATRAAKAASKSAQSVTIEKTPPPVEATPIPGVIVKSGDTIVSSNNSANTSPRNEVGKSVTGDIASLYKNTSPVVQYGLPILGTLVIGTGAMYGVSRLIRSRMK